MYLHCSTSHASAATPPIAHLGQTPPTIIEFQIASDGGWCVARGSVDEISRARNTGCRVSRASNGERKNTPIELKLPPVADKLMGNVGWERGRERSCHSSMIERPAVLSITTQNWALPVVWRKLMDFAFPHPIKLILMLLFLLGISIFSQQCLPRG